MIRKTTAIIFILLANIILLAHVVFPHHHHEQQVCLNLSHCHHTGNDSSTHPADCTHGHDSESPVSNCILKQLVVVPAGQGRIEPVVLYLENLADCFILQAGYSAELQSTELFRKNPYPKDVSIFQSFLDYTQGLRAPPAV
ncbi:MAG: hypothetical protein LC658_07495 [Bacteroidales bacterium]|nr:hypothetical protein [Bacteroidales bacterium]